MSNGSAKSPARSGLAPLLFAAGALIVYFLIISRWQAAPTPESVEQSSAARDGAPQLELSRRLSARTGEAVVSATAEEKSWLWPIAAFLPPLLIGMLWGSARVKGADRELVFGSTHVRTPEADGDQWQADAGDTDAGERADRTAPDADGDLTIDTAASVGNATAAEADAIAAPVDMASAAAQAVEPQLSASDATAPDGDANLAPAMADDTEDDLPNDIESLRAALRARDEVIRTLEEIVRDNRESWSDHEGSASKQARTITALQAELDAANNVIELLQMSDGERTRDESPRPQVMERS